MENKKNLYRLRGCLRAYFQFIIENKDREICIFMGTPRHKNLGDHAIVYAQYKYIEKMYPNMAIFEFSKLEYETYRFLLKRIITKKALIVIDGGGNLGTLWPEEDDLINNVISDFQDNRIIIFPQTAYYEGDKRIEFIKAFSDKINSHKDIILMLRDKASYEIFCDLINKNRLQLCPDIVLSMFLKENDQYTNERNDIGICIRDDLESISEKNTIDLICSALDKKEAGYKMITTFADHNIYPEERERILRDKWNEFASCKLVITDRLHGMIFSAITGTKCFALDNLSKKVSGGYEWVKDLGYITLCKDTDELMELLNEVVYE